MERTQLLLDANLKKKIKLIAKLENKSMASVVRDAVFQYASGKKAESQKNDLLKMFKNTAKPEVDLKPQINSSNFRSQLDKFIIPE